MQLVLISCLLFFILYLKFDRQHLTRFTVRYGNTGMQFCTDNFKQHKRRSRSIKQGILCNTESIVWYINAYVMLCMNKMFNSFFGNIMTRSGNLSCSTYTEQKTTTGVRFPFLKVSLVYLQNIISLFQVCLVLCTPHCCIT